MKNLRASSRSAVAFAVAVVVCVVAASSAFAVSEPQRRAAVGMAEQAAKAFQSGDMAKAADLYLLAARTDPDEPNYLFGAARAEQSARRFDAAEQHYKAFQIAPKADPTRVAKVERYLSEMRGERASQRASEADRLSQKGDPILAASTWLEAYQLAPDRPQYLLSAAVAEREAGDSPSCIAHLEIFLRVAPPEAFERAKAQSLLTQMRKTTGSKEVAPQRPAAVAPAPAPAPPAKPALAPVSAAAVPPGVEAHADAPPARSAAATAGLWTTVGGAVVAVAGVAFLGYGLSERADYDKTYGVDATGAVTTNKSRTEVAAIASSIATHENVGLIVGGVGLAATGVGLWLWLREPSGSAHAGLTPVLTPEYKGLAWTSGF